MKTIRMVLTVLCTAVLVLSGCGEHKTEYERQAEEGLNAILDQENCGYDFALRHSGTTTSSYSYEVADFEAGKLTHFAVFYNSDGSLRTVSNMESFAISGDENGFDRFNLGQVWYVYKRDGEEMLKYDNEGGLRETFEVADLQEAVQLIRTGVEGALANEALAWLSAGE